MGELGRSTLISDGAQLEASESYFILQVPEGKFIWKSSACDNKNGQQKSKVAAA
jgi:hypothetical protein